MTNKRPRSGFTLIEMIIVMTVLAIFSAFFSSTIWEASSAWFQIKSRASASTTARTAMNRLTIDMIRINGASNISTMASSEIDYTAIGGVTMEYKLNGATIERNSLGLVDGALNPGGLQFTYLDQTGNATTENTEIRSIRIWIAIQKNNQISTMESAIMLRNI